MRLLLLVSWLLAAPMQCAGSEPPSARRYEPPGEVLYDLAQEFKKSGQQDAYVATLRYLKDRYPSSRRSKTAQAELQLLLDASDGGAQ